MLSFRKKLMSQYHENFWMEGRRTEGWKNRQTIIHWTLLATAGNPKSNEVDCFFEFNIKHCFSFCLFPFHYLSQTMGLPIFICFLPLFCEIMHMRNNKKNSLLRCAYLKTKLEKHPYIKGTLISYGNLVTH